MQPENHVSQIVKACNPTMFKKNNVSLLTVLVIAGLGLPGFSAAAPDIELAPRLSNEDFGAEQFPGDYAIAVPVGEAGFYPSGAVRVSKVDNLYFQRTGRKTEATQVRVIPKLDLVAEGSKTVFWGLMRGDFRSHDGDGGNADANDFRLRGFAHVDLDNRHRLDAEVSHSQLSEELGTGATREALNQTIDFVDAYSEPDTYNLTRLGLTYSYGNPRSRGELVFGGAVGTLEYVTNEARLAEYDRDMSILWGRFSYKLTGKTTLYSRLSLRNYEYTEDDNSSINRRDRDTSALTFGATWQSGGLWYGDAYVSFSDWEYGEREASSGLAIDGDNTTFGANLIWDIRSYSTATLFARQFNDDSTTGQSDSTQTTSTYGVRWRHGWSERFNTTAAFYTSDDDVDNSVTDSERRVVSLEGRLSIRRWLNVLVGATVDDLDSDGVESTRELMYVGLEGNL